LAADEKRVQTCAAQQYINQMLQKDSNHSFGRCYRKFPFAASLYGWELDKDMTIHAGLVFRTFLLTTINFIIIAKMSKS
jgi:hypothetical protein